jgi:hypothetical protein
LFTDVKQRLCTDHYVLDLGYENWVVAQPVLPSASGLSDTPSPPATGVSPCSVFENALALSPVVHTSRWAGILFRNDNLLAASPLIPNLSRMQLSLRARVLV